MNKLVSIIVPVYNSEKYINECIDSLLNQSYSPIEIIIINDGSTDNCKQICNDYESSFENVRVLNKQNEGVSSARNDGLQIAQGDYIVFCDSDDYVVSDYVEHLVNNIEKFDVDISCCGFFRNPSELIEDVQDNIIVLENEDMYNAICMNDKCSGYMCNKMFKSDIIKIKNQIKFNEKLAILEDQVFIIEYLQYSKKLCFSNKKLYYYRDNPTSVLNQNFSNKSLTTVIAREIIYNKLKNICSNKIVVSDAWNKLIKEYCMSYKNLLLCRLDDGDYWKNYIEQGLELYRNYNKLNDSWSIKEKIYYLCIINWLKIRKCLRISK